jgi:hypothetical protein
MRQNSSIKNGMLSVLASLLLSSVANIASAGVMITGTQLITTVNGTGSVTQNTYVGSAAINPANTLVASQNGTLTYVAKRESDPFPVGVYSVENVLRVSLLVGSTPVLLKDPKIVWDMQHTNEGGDPQFFYQSLADMTLVVDKFLDANNNNMYDDIETLEFTNVGATYVISELDNVGTQHSSGVVSDLSTYGTGIVETLLDPNAHYVLLLTYGLAVDAPDISSNSSNLSINSTLDASDPKYLGPEWEFNLQPVPEPAILLLTFLAAACCCVRRRRAT